MIRLIDARICSDCDTIFNEEETLECPVCTSRQSIKVKDLIEPLENNLQRCEKSGG